MEDGVLPRQSGEFPDNQAAGGVLAWQGSLDGSGDEGGDWDLRLIPDGGVVEVGIHDGEHVRRTGSAAADLEVGLEAGVLFGKGL